MFGVVDGIPRAHDDAEPAHAQQDVHRRRALRDPRRPQHRRPLLRRLRAVRRRTISTCCVAGPSSREVTVSFDEFWNSAHAYPIALLDSRVANAAAGADARFAETIAAAGPRLARVQPRYRAAGASSSTGSSATFAAGTGHVVISTTPRMRPRRARLSSAPQERSSRAAQREVLDQLRRTSFPTIEFRELIRTLVARGVRVAIITNSLATNNHVVAHTGYKQWRREVLACGVELYELRDDAAVLSQYSTPPATATRIGLHTKAIVVDGQACFRRLAERGSALDGTEHRARRRGDSARSRRARGGADRRGTWRRPTRGASRWTRRAGSRGRAARASCSGSPRQGFSQRAVEFLLNLLPLKDQA